jgi:hypothetical protein
MHADLPDLLGLAVDFRLHLFGRNGDHERLAVALQG